MPYSLPHALVPAAVALVATTTLLCSTSGGALVAASIQTRAKREVNIRSSEHLELNCPSIAYQFPPGTIRCESCLAVGEALAFLIDKRSMHPVEAMESVCDGLLENAVLQQTRSGLRYWDLNGFRTQDEAARELFPLASNKDKVEAKGTKAPIVGTDGEPADPYQVTYHTPEERVALPCAHYALKRYCERYLESYEDQIDECTAAFQKRVRDGATADAVLTSNPNRAPPERGGKKLNREIAVEMLSHCLTVPMCELTTKDCYSRMLAAKESEELEQYRKYQGTYGSKQFPYVGDRADKKLYERNPFAAGGARVSENDLLQVPLEDREL